MSEPRGAAEAEAEPRIQPPAAPRQSSPVGFPATVALTGDGAPDPCHIMRGSRKLPYVCLTFDVSSDSGDLLSILAVLAGKGVPATFFLTGDFLENCPEQARAIAGAGHAVGNHLYRHVHLTTWEQNRHQQTRPDLKPADLRRLLQRNESLFRQVTGRSMVHLWRSPFGETNAVLDSWAWEIGYVQVSWTRDFATGQSMDTLDWVSEPDASRYLSVAQIKARILDFGGKVPGGANGAIILMHTGNQRHGDHPWTILPDVIDGMRARGYVFVDVPRMLREGEPPGCPWSGMF